MSAKLINTIWNVTKDDKLRAERGHTIHDELMRFQVEQDKLLRDARANDNDYRYDAFFDAREGIASKYSFLESPLSFPFTF